MLGMYCRLSIDCYACIKDMLNICYVREKTAAAARQDPHRAAPKIDPVILIADKLDILYNI
jgi:hypothetical protein